MTHQTWNQLTDRQRTAIAVLASIELALTATAAVDLWFRPKEAVRGPKALWWPALFIQPVGPIAYLSAGRRRPRH
ncbi:hypothetical protein Aple_000460 [Acrocarpospora pleiomorpha]|uniref:Cardiolipin synthase N-terminal domain-containing protein n=1 Tax=Acrocarpospora pleiomorpha TaxID=90975 RepID=A0A5M3XCB5_9ACTN|nr:PLD nuclease N-terminal domain-containing protein [Acrocarpospora pleiomorpha]GES17151.1 hypothetical protein Aple_000460 [Acrocarpospora pleiomorpha]